VIEVRRLTASQAREHLAALAGVLTDCVEGGASLSLLAPFSQTDAAALLE
jgi:hypothetical protein